MTQNKIKNWNDCIKAATELFKSGYIAVELVADFMGGEEPTCDFLYWIRWYATLPAFEFEGSSDLIWRTEPAHSFFKYGNKGVLLMGLQQHDEQEHHFIKTLPAPWNSLTKIGEDNDDD